MNLKTLLLLTLCWAGAFGYLPRIMAQETSEISTPIVGDGGFFLNKTVTNTTVCTGQEFSYIIEFTIPAHATGFTITDQLDSDLQLATGANAIDIASCGIAPVVTSTGGNIVVSFNNALAANPPTTPCNGSITVNVLFNSHTTCDNTIAENAVSFSGTIQNNPIVFTGTTEVLTTVAQAESDWYLHKFIDPVPMPAICGSSTVQNVFRHCLRLSNWGAFNGQTCALDLCNFMIQDEIPVGATIDMSSISSASTVNVVSAPGNPFANTVEITWPGHACLNGTVNDIVQVCYNVIYPPVAGTYYTSALGSGTLGNGCDNVQLYTIGIDTVAKVLNTTPDLITKSVSFDNNAHYIHEGCTGTYTISVCNNTGSTLTNATVKDNLNPAGSVLWGAYLLNNATMAVAPAPNGFVLNIATLAPGQTATATIDFTVNAPGGTVISNTAVLYSAGGVQLASSEAPFTVRKPFAKGCVEKVICNRKQDGYLPGETFSYRLIFKNRGTAPWTNIIISDVLNEYLSLVPGSIQYYTTMNTAPGIAQCGVPAAAGVWPASSNPVIFNLTSQGNDHLMTWSIPLIPPTDPCVETGCSQGPTYIIEFEVMVNADAPLGVIDNCFNIDFDEFPVGAPYSFTQFNACTSALIDGAPAFSINKNTVEPEAIPNGQLTYDLQFHNIGQRPLSRVLLLDELPVNSASGDQTVITCAPRGNTTGLTFDATLSTNPAAIHHSVPGLDISEENLYSVIVTPPYGQGVVYFPNCSPSNTIASWPTGSSDANLYYDFGSNSILPGNQANATFRTNVPANAQGNICNSFAANAAYSVMVNGGANLPATHVQYETLTPSEARSCVAVRTTSDSACYQCHTTTQVKQFKCAGALDYLQVTVGNHTNPDNAICSIQITASNMSWNALTGVASISGVPGTAAVVGNTATFTPTGNFGMGQSMVMNLYYLTPPAFSGSINIEVHYCNGICDTLAKWKPNNITAPEHDTEVILANIPVDLDSIFVQTLQLDKLEIADARPVHYIQINIPEDQGAFLAVTGAVLDGPGLPSGGLKCRLSQQSEKSVYLELLQPLTAANIDKGTLQLIFQDAKPQKLEIFYYSEDAAVIHTQILELPN